MRFLLAFLPAFLLSTHATQANVLLRASEISLNSPDQKTNLSNIKAVINVQCNYSYGFLLERFKNCGTSKLEVSASNDKIILSEIKFFKGSEGKKLKNYKLQVNFYENKNWLGGLNLFGEQSLKRLDLGNKTLYIHKISAGKIDLSYKGKSIFLSDRTKDLDAYLQVSILPMNDLNGMNLTSAFTSLASVNSDNYSTSFGKKELSKMTEISFPTDAYLSFTKPSLDRFNLWVSLANYKNASSSLKKSLEIAVSDRTFEELDSIELD